MVFQGGITEEEMQDEAVQQEVCQYIEESGGVNKIIELSQVIDYFKTVNRFRLYTGWSRVCVKRSFW